MAPQLRVQRLMARTAQRQSVRDVVPHVGEVGPALDVVRVHPSVRTMGAPLTRIGVAPFHGQRPRSVVEASAVNQRDSALPTPIVRPCVFSLERGANSLTALRGMAESSTLGVRHSNGCGKRRLVLGGHEASGVPVEELSSAALVDSGRLPTTARTQARLNDPALTHHHSRMVSADEARRLAALVTQTAIGQLGNRRKLAASALAKHTLFYREVRRAA